MSDMKVESGILSKLTTLVFCLLLAAGLVAVCVWYLPVLHQNESMRRELLQLDAQIAQAQATNKLLNNAISALHRDPKTVERLAREKLGYARTGEVVIHFEPAAAVAATPALLPR